MKIIHTSDWHLGQQLCQRKRETEHQAFLNWLLDCIERESIEALLLAGDVFDSGVPANYALEMYYSFLAKCLGTSCRQIVVVGGNHDSPATLRAPEQLLKALKVHVVSVADVESPERDVIMLCNASGEPQALVCAVPYLRDRDIHAAKAGENAEEYALGIIEGTAQHYQAIVSSAVGQRNAMSKPDLPIIATGHLYAQGMRASDSERKLYIGNLGAFPPRRFPQDCAYVALGHLHRPQIAAKNENVRYSGAPLPLSFAEANYAHQVLVIDTECMSEVQSVKVPAFRKLVQISGDLITIDDQLQKMSCAEGKPEPWVEVIYTGQELLLDLREQVDAMITGLPLQILVTRNEALLAPEQGTSAPIDIQQMEPEQIFDRLLVERGISEADKLMVKGAFDQVLHELQTGDRE